MIPTNQLQIAFDHDAIARRFVIVEAKRDTGDYKGSVIPDLALQAGHALAVAYEWGNCCYILYDHKSTDRQGLKALLEQESDDVQLREVASTEFDPKRSFLLAQLLLNAIPALDEEGHMYHNLTGRLYYTDPHWRRGKEIFPRSFWALQIRLTGDSCVRLPVVTFCRAESKPGKSAPQYLFDGQNLALRRLIHQDPDRETPRYVIGAQSTKWKNTVPFLEFGSLEAFQQSKVGVLQRVLEDASRLLSPCITLSIQSLTEENCLGSKPVDPKFEKIRARLRQVPLYLEDTVRNEDSASLAGALCRELKAYSEITVQDGTLGPGEALFRIVHNREFYADCPEQDPYRQAPRHCAVQHLTVEDFHLQEIKEDAPLKKILQEMAIKLDVRRGQITCYDWPSLGYKAPVSFVIIANLHSAKGEPALYRRLQVQPDGSLQYSQWQEQSVWEDPEQQKIDAAFRKWNGQTDSRIEGLVYEDVDDIHIIRQTDRFTLPDTERLQQLLAATPDNAFVPVAPLVEVIQALLPGARDEDRQNLELLLCNLEELGPQATRRQLRGCLNLRTKLGRSVNEEIFARTGILIGSGLKQKATMEALLGGTLGIRQFRQGRAQFYYAGYRSQDLQHGLARACRIRKVSSTGEEVHFERYLPLLEVDFVRAGAWTVLPFPFKYLREWEPA